MSGVLWTVAATVIASVMILLSAAGAVAFAYVALVEARRWYDRRGMERRRSWL